MATSGRVSPQLRPSFFPEPSSSSSVLFSPLFGHRFFKSKRLPSLSIEQKPKTFPISGLSARSFSLVSCSIASPSPSTTPATSSSASDSTTFCGLSCVVGDNIDIDQIIGADFEFLSKPDEYEKLDSVAVAALTSSSITRFIEPGQKKSKFSVVIAGSNFGCGLSRRELAPGLAALEASGVAAVVAESYAPPSLRDWAATCGIHPLVSEGRICEECKTGHVVTVEMGESRLINHTTGKKYKLKLIGDHAGPVIEPGGGGNLVCGRQNGKIPSHWAHIIVSSVCNLVILLALLVGQRKVTINNIINDQSQSPPKITSIQNQSRFGVSVCNVKGKVDQ